MLNLDTHILIHALTATLKPRERKLLTSQPWSISAIVLWELTKLAQLGRIELDLEDPRVRRLLARLHVWPIDLQVCRAMTQLDFRGDPADELIAATSLAHGVPLLTRDTRIRGSKVVPLA
ncbi:MAG: PIN domain-containing protein [Polyangia bacterium]|jgi:PIN domain nuclease of toxin-antitoxin system|nr:PIN domain-containing protein [Polyangia bacterium]